MTTFTLLGLLDDETTRRVKLTHSHFGATMDPVDRRFMGTQTHLNSDPVARYCPIGEEAALRYLLRLGEHLGEERVQRGELAAQVDVALEARRVGDGLRVGDLQQEALHVAPLVLQELVHEGHVLLLVAEPDERNDTLNSKVTSGWRLERSGICPWK